MKIISPCKTLLGSTIKLMTIVDILYASTIEKRQSIGEEIIPTFSSPTSSESIDLTEHDTSPITRWCNATGSPNPYSFWGFAGFLTKRDSNIPFKVLATSKGFEFRKKYHSLSWGMFIVEMVKEWYEEAAEIQYPPNWDEDKIKWLEDDSIPKNKITLKKLAQSFNATLTLHCLAENTFGPKNLTVGVYSEHFLHIRNVAFKSNLKNTNIGVKTTDVYEYEGGSFTDGQSCFETFTYLKYRPKPLYDFWFDEGCWNLPNQNLKDAHLHPYEDPRFYTSHREGHLYATYFFKANDSLMENVCNLRLRDINGKVQGSFTKLGKYKVNIKPARQNPPDHAPKWTAPWSTDFVTSYYRNATLECAFR